MHLTMKDVAAKAKVSPTTVSLILNKRDKDFKISQKTRQKVLKVVQETGYVPDLYAQTMRQRKTLTIGMVVTNILNPSVALIAEGAKAEAVKHGYHIILGLSSDEADQERFYVENFLSRFNRLVPGDVQSELHSTVLVKTETGPQSRQKIPDDREGSLADRFRST